MIFFCIYTEMNVSAPKCFKNNGGCEQTCEMRDDTTVQCGCMMGYQLNRDGHTCSGDHIIVAWILEEAELCQLQHHSFMRWPTDCP